MVTVNVSTIGSGGTYPTIAAWEAATDNDLVTQDRIEVGELLNQDHDTSATTLSFTGATTDATHYRILRAADGARWSPSAGTGARITHTGAGYPILIREEGFRLCDVAVHWTVASPNAGNAAIGFSSDATNSNGVAAVVDSVTVYGTFTSGNGNKAIWGISSAAFPKIIRNCLLVGTRSATTGYSIGLDEDNTTLPITVQNCGAYRMATVGFDHAANIAHEYTNNWAVGNATKDFQWAGGVSNIVAKSNASGDATADDAGGAGNITGIKDYRAFIAAPLNDFRPQADGPLHQAGVNLSASFTQDITQNAYGAKWNIGPYGQSVRNGNSRANDTRIIQVVFASGVDWAFIDTRGYDYMLIYPIGGVGTDPTSGTITFGAFAVDSEFTVSDITDPGERADWASMPNIAGIHRQATMTSTAVNFGYMKVLPTRILLWASGGSGWSNVPVRVELHRANEHWTEAGRG